MCSCASLIADTARHFDERKARQELASYHTGGPASTTRGLLRLLTPGAPPPETILDIGSGIGALSFGLLAAGVQHAICVDLSRAALTVNAEEAQRQGVGNRVVQVAGDFVAVAATLPEVDLVTLDRVVCCYPAYAPLLEQAATHSRRLLAISYPRDRWWVRFALRIENAWRRLRGDGFRAFVHPPAAMAELLSRRGFARSRTASTFTWQLEVYEATGRSCMT
jgi:SAM-dependent methyltransferase